jgi:hypothetical protein
VIVAIVLGASALGAPEPVFAGPTLYTASIQLQLSNWSGCGLGVCINDFGAGYAFPFGASISYPSLNNLSSGNLASVSGSAPAAVAIGSNHITLQTSLYDTSPPTSWNVTFASTSFAGKHAAGGFFGGGAPGSTSSFALASVPYGRLEGPVLHRSTRHFAQLRVAAVCDRWKLRWDCQSATHLPWRHRGDAYRLGLSLDDW